MSIKFEAHIDIDSPKIILDSLSSNIELSKQQLKKLMQNGSVWLENSHGIQRVRRAKKKLHMGDKLHVYYDEKIQITQPPIAHLIADEGGYSIWNKPCGMYSQGTKWGDHCTIYRWAEQHLTPQRSAFIVHRLDKAANGLMIIAHTKKLAAKFSKLFEQRNINKTYRARVEGKVENIDLPHEIKNQLDNKLAISEIVAIKNDNNNLQTELEIKIKTGRKHQIRRHLSTIGHPIIGDRLYGAKNIQQDLQLSSVELAFVCPLTSQQKIYILEKHNKNK